MRYVALAVIVVVLALWLVARINQRKHSLWMQELKQKLVAGDLRGKTALMLRSTHADKLQSQHDLTPLSKRQTKTLEWGDDASLLRLRRRPQITFTSCNGPDSIAGWITTNPELLRSMKRFVT